VVAGVGVLMVEQAGHDLGWYASRKRIARIVSQTVARASYTLVATRHDSP
jgi:hypothetical protein